MLRDPSMWMEVFKTDLSQHKLDWTGKVWSTSGLFLIKDSTFVEHGMTGHAAMALQGCISHPDVGTYNMGMPMFPGTNAATILAASICRLGTGLEPTGQANLELFGAMSSLMMMKVRGELEMLVAQQPFLLAGVVELIDPYTRDGEVAKTLHAKTATEIATVLEDFNTYRHGTDKVQRKSKVGGAFCKKEQGPKLRAICTMTPVEKYTWSPILIIQKALYCTEFMQAFSVKGLDKDEVHTAIRYLFAQSGDLEGDQRDTVESDDWSKFEQGLRDLLPLEAQLLCMVANLLGFQDFAENFLDENTTPRKIRAAMMTFFILCRASGTYHTAVGNQWINMLLGLTCRFISATERPESKFYLPGAAYTFQNNERGPPREAVLSAMELWFEEETAARVVEAKIDTKTAVAGLTDEMHDLLSRVGKLAANSNQQGLHVVYASNTGMKCEGDDGVRIGHGQMDSDAVKAVYENLAMTTTDEMSGTSELGAQFLQILQTIDGPVSQVVKSLLKLPNVDAPPRMRTTKYCLLLRMKAYSYLVSTARSDGSIEPMIGNLCKRIGQLTAGLTPYKGFRKHAMRNLSYQFMRSQNFDLDPLLDRLMRKEAFETLPDGTAFYVDWKRGAALAKVNTEGWIPIPIAVQAQWATFFDNWSPGQPVPFPSTCIDHPFYRECLQGMNQHRPRQQVGSVESLSREWQTVVAKTSNQNARSLAHPKASEMPNFTRLDANNPGEIPMYRDVPL